MSRKSAKNQDFSSIETDIEESNNKKEFQEDMEVSSERTYNGLATRIVISSIEIMEKSIETNSGYRLYLIIVFTILLVLFMTGLGIMLYSFKEYDPRVIIIYVSTLMIEIVVTFQLIIRLVFDNKYQAEIIAIIHKFLENFQKYNKSK